MKIKNYFLLLIFIIFLIGCQQVEQETAEQPDTVEIIDEPAEEIDEEFDDDLDEALQELKEIEDI